MFDKIIKNQDNEGNNNSTSTSSAKPASGPVTSSPASSSPAKSPSPNSPAISSSSPSGQRNILSNDVDIKGTVRFQNDLLVDGKIEGEISSDGSLTVAENAHIKAEIKTKSVVIYGKVHGNIVATEKIEVKANAEMVGDIKAPTLSIEAGSIFVGKSEVGTPSAQPKSAPAKTDSKPLPNENAKKSSGNPSPSGQKDLITP